MKNEKKMNVLVLGPSGVGKSTLIKSISGVEVITGVGSSKTQKIEVCESSTWPIRCIDTKGFEYNLVEQLKTIRQVNKYTKTQLAKGKNESSDIGIDAVWYCVSGTGKRIFLNNINLMKNAVKGWKNVPIFVVITKSYSDVEIKENIEAVKKTFAKVKGLNLKKIIPVVAEEYIINEDAIVLPKGIEELCLSTLDCIDEAKNINVENRNRMILEQKRFTANAITTGATATSFAIGAIPLNFADSQLLVPIEVGLVSMIFKIYGVKVSKDLTKAIIGSSAITLAAKQVVTLVKTLPIAGDIINGTVAGAFVFALGEGTILVSEGIYTGKIKPDETEEIAKVIAKNISENKIIKATISYFEKNGDKLAGKSAKEIFESIVESVSKKK